MKEVEVHTQGLFGSGKMVFGVRSHKCGDIEGGISVRLRGKDAPIRGSWVVSFEDLRRVVIEAAKIRNES